MLAAAVTKKEPNNRQDLIHRFKGRYADLLPVEYIIKTCQVAWPRFRRNSNNSSSNTTNGRSSSSVSKVSTDAIVCLLAKVCLVYLPMANLAKSMNVYHIQSQNYVDYSSCFK